LEGDDLITVYVSANPDMAGAAVAMVAGGAQVRTSDDIPPGQRWTDGLISLLRGCDALVVIPTGQATETIFLETGVALGLGVPVVVAVPEGTGQETVPIVLRDFPVVALAPGRLAHLRLVNTLEAVTSAPEAGSPLPGRVGASPSVIGRDLESRVAAVFLRSGAQVVDQFAVAERRRADLAVWVNDVLTPAFNPVIVEVKADSADTTVVSGVAQVESYLTELGLLLGLVVVPQASPANWHVNGATQQAVGVVGIRELEAMDAEALQRFLAAGRNQLVHGAM
jgi:hypothetical protein